VPERRIVISIPHRKLALVEDGRVREVYPIAVGASSSPTPTGQMRIINKLIAPTYYHRGQIIPPGKSNPLGSRWLGLSKGGYGIHGTNVSSSIGKAASHGCIRMRKRDIEDLFEWVRVDDVVEVRTERDTRWAGVFEGAETVAYSASEPPVQAEPQPSPVAAAVMAGQF
jgi:lipoprotein-anchoring transpeptidase ErfK/SrfK